MEDKQEKKTNGLAAYHAKRKAEKEAQKNNGDAPADAPKRRGRPAVNRELDAVEGFKERDMPTVDEGLRPEPVTTIDIEMPEGDRIGDHDKYLLYPLTQKEMRYIGKYVDPETKEIVYLGLDKRSVLKYKAASVAAFQKERGTEPKYLKMLISKASPLQFVINRTRPEEQAFVEALKRDPRVLMEGEQKAKANSVLFLLVQKNKRSQFEYIDMLQNFLLQKDALQSTFAEKKNLLYFLGGNAMEKSSAEITLELLGQKQDGLIFKNKTKVEKYKNTPSNMKRYELVFRMAMTFGEIVFDGRNYKRPSGHLLADSEERAIAYLREHPDMFEIVERECDLKNSLNNNSDDLEKIDKIARETLRAKSAIYI